MMFKEYDIVKLTRDLVDVEDSFGNPATVQAETYGTVLTVYSAAMGFPENKPLDYEIEFCDSNGNTIALMPVSEAHLELDSTYEQRQANVQEKRLR